MSMKDFNYTNVLSFGSWLAINEARTYDNKGFSFEDIKKLQTFLVNTGFMNVTRPNGKPAIDGMFGSETMQSLAEYQKSQKLSNLGEIDDKTLKTMNLSFKKISNLDTGTVYEMPYGDAVEPGVSKLSRIIDGPNERGQIIEPSSAKVVFVEGFKRLTAEQWIEKGYKNFINLTFFEPDGTPTANFYSNGINLGAKLGTLGKYWPMMIIKPKLEIVDNANQAMFPQEAFSGSAVIVKNGQAIATRQQPNEASLGRRTAVGITNNNDIIVMVSTRSTVNGIGEKMQQAGARDAINMDGGGSPLFVREGKILISTGRALPTILAW